MCTYGYGYGLSYLAILASPPCARPMALSNFPTTIVVGVSKSGRSATMEKGIQGEREGEREREREREGGRERVRQE